MTRYVISGKVGSADTFEPNLAGHDRLASVDLRIPGTNDLRFGITKALTRASSLGLAPTAVGVDLLVLAALVYSADTRVRRANAAQDQWTRELRLVVPVSNEPLWTNSSNLLERTLRFLTGDIWTVEFRQSPSPHSIPNGGALAGPPPFDCISLFSGGLDSLIGAIDLLEQKKTPLFVSHGGAGAVSKPQTKLFESLATKYRKGNTEPKRVRLGLSPPSSLFEGIGGEPSTRGRSFLFFALASMMGSGLCKPFDLWVPENGLISLNVPLDVTRLGSNSTRTTHPFYMHRWNELLTKLGIPGKLINPYWNKTKGEMVMECQNDDVLEQLHAKSISCAHPDTARWAGGGDAHCGTCLPCLIRRASLRQTPWAGGDRTGYRFGNLLERPLRASLKEGVQVRGFQIALSRLAANPELAQTLVYLPGPLREDQSDIPELAGVYARGMAEVGVVLQNVVTIP
jgi:hypothetical protein